jgi:hypothetical protein
VPRTNQRRIAVHDMTATEWFPSGPPSIEQQTSARSTGAARVAGGSGVHRRWGPVGSYLSGSLIGTDDPRPAGDQPDRRSA